MEIKDRQQLEDWMKTQPKDVCVIIAARAALRVLPAIVTTLRQYPDDFAARFALPIFRADAVAWFAGAWPHSGQLGRKASNAANVAGDAASAGGHPVHATDRAIVYSGNRVASAAASAARVVADSAGFFATVAVDTAAIAATATDGSTFALSEDVEVVGRVSHPARRLSHEAIWIDSIPDIMPILWRRLKENLPPEDDWNVWIDWYERRLTGNRGPVEYEQIFVDIEDDLWSKGPAAVNAHIKQRLAELEGGDGDGEVFAQRPSAFAFHESGGKIVATPQSDLPADPAFAVALYDEVKRKAQALEERLQNTNAAPRVKQSVANILEALGDTLDDVNPAILLMRQRSLDADTRAYDTDEGRAELYPDAIAELYDAAASVNDLLSVFAIVQSIMANAITVEVQTQDIGAVQAHLSEIRAGASGSDLVDQSASDALNALDADVAKATEDMETATSDEEEAEARARQARIVAIQTLDHRNFVARVFSRVSREMAEVGAENWAEARKGLKKGTGQIVETGWKASPAAALAAMLLHPVAGLAVYLRAFYSLAKSPPAKSLEKAKREKPPKDDGGVET